MGPSNVEMNVMHMAKKVFLICMMPNRALCTG